MEPTKLWIRLGISLMINKEEVEKIINGDKDLLLDIIEKRKFKIEGETYIPSSSIEEYNDVNNTDHQLVDVEFELF